MVTRAPSRSAPELPRLRISIRYKLLLVISAVLLIAVGAYVYLASTLFTRDKLAYVFDVNASLVETLSEQARSNLTVLGQELAMYARDAEGGAEQRKAAAEELFHLEPDLVRLELYRRAKGGFERLSAMENPSQLAPLGVTSRDLDVERAAHPLPLAAIAARPRRLHVQNSSIPPDAALLALALAVDSPQGRLVAAAELRHDRLLRIFGSSQLHDTYLLDSRGVVLASAAAAKVLTRADLSDHPLVKGALAGSVDRAVREYQAPSGEAMLGAFARVDAGDLLVLTEITRDEALRAGRELIRRSLYFAAAVLLCTILVSIFLSRLVTSPIRRLRAATEEVARGHFDIAIDVTAGDEIGDLGRSFVHMSRALREAQAQLVRSEKLAAFGQLGAGITHELKNPLTGIVGFAQIAQRQLDRADKDKLKELLGLIEAEGLRCKDILVNFLRFARQQPGPDALPLDLNDLVQSSAKIAGHQLALNQIKLELDLSPQVPRVLANGSELQQVLLNLAINAQQAMPEGGRVRLRTRRTEEGQAEIAVEDDGPGIPEEIRDRIFEPFFTTKAAGEGTGLGLAISMGIVRDHKGALTVESEPGKGTTFFIRLPPAPADPQEAKKAASA